MNEKRMTVAAAALLLCGMSFVSACDTNGSQTTSHNHQGQQSTPSPAAQSSGRRIPAYFKTAPDPKSLPPTLSPENFTGETREAYQVAKDIPVTLAQLPCFCYCDAEPVGRRCPGP